MSFLRQFCHLLGDCRRLLGLSVMCGLVFAGANLLPPLLIRELILWITEGGGSSLFYEGRKIGGTPIEDEIAAACDVVFEDEVEHSGHGAQMLQHALETEDEWATVRKIVTAICQQRIRMRYEMFGLPIPEDRIQQVTDGKIEILNIQA